MKKTFLSSLPFSLCFSISADELKNDWMETKYVWNLGMAAFADKGLGFRPKSYFLFHTTFVPAFYAGIKKGDVVWIPSRFTNRFIHEVLPYVKEPFVALINDGDESFPKNYGFNNWEECLAFINHPNIIHLFCQNYDLSFKHPKVSPIPIGIDYHSVAYKQENMWGVSGSPVNQEKALEQIIQTFEPTTKRIKKAFVDFHHFDSMRREFMRYIEFGEDRTQIFQKLLKTGLIDYSEKLNRIDLWNKKVQYAFSISPPGNGLDCHRTWEDLALGCIVIVKRCNMEPLYEGLPVVVVDDFSEVTEENLSKWLDEFGDVSSNPAYREKLTQKYWMNKIFEKSQKFLSSESIKH